MRLAAAGLGADASQAPIASQDSPRSRPQQSEVHQVGLLHQRRQKVPELHEELDESCQHPNGEGARIFVPTSGVGEGLEQQGGGCLSSSSFRSQDGCALWECIKSVHQLCVGASRGMCSRGLRQESFLILCDALRACTAKRGTLLKIKNLSILKCIFQSRFERVAPAS